NWIVNVDIETVTTTVGSFVILRNGGTVAVTAGATITIDQNATLNLGGSLDSLNDGTRQVNITNNSTSTFNVLQGTKNIGALSGLGNSNISSGATLIVNQTSNTTHSGSISGSGTLTKNGAGALNLKNVRLGALNVNA